MPLVSFVDGETPAASKFNLLSDQTVPTFPDAPTRSAQWPAPPLGARSVLTNDPGTLWFYDSQWRVMSGPGVLGKTVTAGIIADGVTSGFVNLNVGPFDLIAGHGYRFYGSVKIQGSFAQSATFFANFGDGFPSPGSAVIGSCFKPAAPSTWSIPLCGASRINTSLSASVRVYLIADAATQVRDGVLAVEDLGPT